MDWRGCQTFQTYNTWNKYLHMKQEVHKHTLIKTHSVTLCLTTAPPYTQIHTHTQTHNTAEQY